MNKENNKKSVRVRYVILGIFILIYILYVADIMLGFFEYDPSLIAVASLSLLPVGITCTVVSFIMLKKDSIANKIEKRIAMLGIVLGIPISLLPGVVWAVIGIFTS
jgi:hypothetical protein